MYYKVKELPEKIEFKIIHRFEDSIVIESAKLTNFLEELKSDDPIITSHLNWWKKSNRCKPKTTTKEIEKTYGE